MSVFRFKRFEVRNERSAMKVNTDGVLLGALMSVSADDSEMLDIGTGTGTVALMAAQRIDDLRKVCGAAPVKRFTVRAIDIDEPSAAEAADNFANSPWRGSLVAYRASLKDFAAGHNGRFDLIFSNPPYFDNALHAPEKRRNAARHTSTGLSYREILEFSAERLSESGRVAMVLPADTEADLTRHARMNGLFLYGITRVRTVPRKMPNRIVVEFSRQRPVLVKDTVLTIQDGGQYTAEYLGATRDFYLFA